MILKPAFLRVEDQFVLNMAISLGVRDYLIERTSESVHIKWPNDILVHGSKISGILIENQVQAGRFHASVVGIGLNVNQIVFGIPGATSLKCITGASEPLEGALHQLLQGLEGRYLQLRSREEALLRSAYLDNLYGLNERRFFNSARGNFEGIIRGIDSAGRLAVESSQGRDYFGVKEIKFIA